MMTLPENVSFENYLSVPSDLSALCEDCSASLINRPRGQSDRMRFVQAIPTKSLRLTERLKF